MHEGQVLIYQVPRPDPLRGFINSGSESRKRHGDHDYGVVYTRLFEQWLQSGETALGYDHPMIIEDGVMMSPSPVPAQDNKRIAHSPAIQIFGAARERRLYALPAYTSAQSLQFDDLAFTMRHSAHHCSICLSIDAYLDNLGSEDEPQWVCSDSECCQLRADALDV